MYKLFKNNLTGFECVIDLQTFGNIPFDPANIDYQQFKKQINADEAQLRDTEDRVMTPEQAKAYVATLP